MITCFFLIVLYLVYCSMLNVLGAAADDVAAVVFPEILFSDSLDGEVGGGNVETLVGLGCVFSGDGVQVGAVHVFPLSGLGVWVCGVLPLPLYNLTQNNRMATYRLRTSLGCTAVQPDTEQPNGYMRSQNQSRVYCRTT